MFRMQERLERGLLRLIIEFNEGRSTSPGVVVCKGYKETKTGVLLETFPLSGTQLAPAGASSFFRLDWDDLKDLANRFNVSLPN